MTFSRKITSLAVAAAVTAGTILPLSTAADARSRHGGGHYAGKHYDGGYGYAGSQHRHYGYRKKRNDTGKAIAIGAGLLMLGIIASEASRGHRHRYDD